MSPMPGRGAARDQRPALRGVLESGIAQETRGLLQGRGAAQLLVRGQQFLKPRIAHHGALRRSDHHLLGGGGRLGQLRRGGGRQQAGGVPRNGGDRRERGEARHQLPAELSVVGRLAAVRRQGQGHILDSRLGGTGRRTRRGFLRQALVQAASKCRIRAVRALRRGPQRIADQVISVPARKGRIIVPAGVERGRKSSPSSWPSARADMSSLVCIDGFMIFVLLVVFADRGLPRRGRLKILSSWLHGWLLGAAASPALAALVFQQGFTFCRNRFTRPENPGPAPCLWGNPWPPRSLHSSGLRFHAG